MAEKQPTAETKYYWSIANEFLKRPHIARGSLMGFPCLRADGEFFSTCEHRSGNLIVKLPRVRVSELIAAERGAPLAPAGRIFKEWLQVSKRNKKAWTALMEEGLAFAESKKK